MQEVEPNEGPAMPCMGCMLSHHEVGGIGADQRVVSPFGIPTLTSDAQRIRDLGCFSKNRQTGDDMPACPTPVIERELQDVALFSAAQAKT